MTTETQTFIELADIKSIRIECSKCRIKTTISLEDEPSRDRLRALVSRFQCPICSAEWFTHKDSSYLEKVARFFEGMESNKAKERDECNYAA